MGKRDEILQAIADFWREERLPTFGEGPVQSTRTHQHLDGAVPPLRLAESGEDHQGARSLADHSACS